MTEKLYIALYILGTVFMLGGALYYWLANSPGDDLTGESSLVPTSDQNRQATPDEGTV